MVETVQKAQKVLANLGALVPDLESVYKDIHSHPELSMQEKRTAGLALDKGVPLDRFKALVMPSGLPKLSAEQTARLDTSPPAEASLSERERRTQELWRAPKPRPEDLASALEPRGYVLGQLTRKPDGRTFILHLLNYNHQAAAENVKVRLDLNGLVPDLSRWEVKVLSPDATQPQFSGLSLCGTIAEFTLGRIEHYTAVTLSAPPGP
jgi:hypothetical protein